jgi:fructosamine-3-kinase
VDLSDATLTRVGGGSINAAFRAELPDGTTAFVKRRDDAPPGEFAAEAAGLRWLGEAGARVPEVLDQGDDYLVLEWIDDDRTDPDELGRSIATMHRAGAPRHGSLPPGISGDFVLAGVVLPNTEADDWPRFYAEHRLAPLLPRAGLSAKGNAAVESVIDRIDDLAGPPEPPARLHGDLWGGNVHGNALIDPAAYGGHREVDLAMLKLFGGPGPRAFAAYDEAFPLQNGHEERVPLYQLFPLLIHAVLFGGGYAGQVEQAARRFA